MERGNLVVTSRVRYQLENHLGSAALELDGSGLVISYEEYHPYGTSAYHAVASAVQVSAKRYRYTGKERDEETGLYYHGARYYAPWLGRWTSADPAGMVDGVNRYAYVHANPLGAIDPTGTREVRVPKRPKGLPANVNRWAYGGEGVILSGSQDDFVQRTQGMDVFVFDPKADPKNLATMDAAATRAGMANAASMMASLLSEQPSRGGSNRSGSHPEETTNSQKDKTRGEAFARGIAVAGALANLDAPTGDVGGNPNGIAGGANPNASSSPLKQAVFGGVQIVAGVIDFVGIAKAAAKAVSAKLIGRELILNEGQEQAIEKAAKEAG